MNEQLTLKELKRQITLTDLCQTPMKVELVENGRLIACHESEEFTISVFSCGYALAEAGKRWTVFSINGNGGYEYDADETDREMLRAEDYRFEDDYFLDLPWTIRLSMEALDRLERNNASREKSLISEHPDVPGPGGRLYGRYVSVEEAVIRRIQLEEMMKILTPKQREVMELSIEGYTQIEIGKSLGIGQPAVWERIHTAEKRIASFLKG